MVISCGREEGERESDEWAVVREPFIFIDKVFCIVEQHLLVPTEHMLKSVEWRQNGLGKDEMKTGERPIQAIDLVC